MKKLNTFVVLLFLLLTNCARVDINQNRTIANSTTDQILGELRTALQSSISDDRKNEIRLVQENLVKYLIEMTNSDEAYRIKVFNDATVYFNKVYPVLLSNIKNEKTGFANFTPIVKAPLWTLKDELEYLNKNVANLPNGPFKIDLIEGLKVVAPVYQNLSLEEKNKLGQVYGNTANKLAGGRVDLVPSFEEIDKIVQLDGSDDEKILKVVSIIENKLQKHEKAIRNIGTEIAKSGQMDMTNNSLHLIVRFMDYYFNKLPEDTIKTIMSELVTAGPKITEEGMMAIIFQNTGPGLGKLLQQLGKNKGVGDKFAGLMAVLESNGKQVPYHLVEKIVSTDEGGFEVSKISQKALGTGTIAQVNKATLVDNGVEKEVALRFLKPGVARRCHEDIAILRQFVPDNEALLKKEGITDLKMMSTLIDSIESFLTDEVDLKKSVERQKQAYEIYSRAVKISENPKYHLLEMKVPEVYIAPNGSSNLHIQEFVTGGEKFAELTDTKAQKIVAEEMMQMWFEEALFKSGFLNADLHQGNFRINLIEADGKIKVILYDFGMSSTLTKEEQRSFLLLGAGAYLKSPKTITDGLMASMNSADKSLREKLIKEISAELKLDPTKTAEGWLGWCVQKNYFVSEKMGSLARGSLLLRQLPESIGQTEMFAEVIVKAAKKNLVQAVVDRHYDFPLTKMDLVKLVAIEAGSSCVKAIKAFFHIN